MPAWFSFAAFALSTSAALLSYLAVKEAERTGKLRFFFWRVRGWGERELDPKFFDLRLRFDRARTIFFVALAVLLLAYFLGAISASN